MRLPHYRHHEQWRDSMSDRLGPLEMQVRLESRGAQFVTYARIPLMYVPPEVVLWGDRVFILASGQHRAKDGVFVYYEAITARVEDSTQHDTRMLPAPVPLADEA